MDRGAAVPLIDGCLHFAMPLVPALHCPSCDKTKWTGASRHSTAISHYRSHHSDAVVLGMVFKCSVCNHQSASYQQGNKHFTNSHAAPVHNPSSYAVALTDLEGDTVIIPYPGGHSKCPLCDHVSYLHNPTAKMANSMLANNLTAHFYHRHGKRIVTHTWRCRVCRATGNGNLMSHRHRHQEGADPPPAAAHSPSASLQLSASLGQSVSLSPLAGNRATSDAAQQHVLPSPPSLSRSTSSSLTNSSSSTHLQASPLLRRQEHVTANADARSLLTADPSQQLLSSATHLSSVTLSLLTCSQSSSNGQLSQQHQTEPVALCLNASNAVEQRKEAPSCVGRRGPSTAPALQSDSDFSERGLAELLNRLRGPDLRDDAASLDSEEDLDEDAPSPQDLFFEDWAPLFSRCATMRELDSVLSDCTSSWHCKTSGKDPAPQNR